MVELKLFNKKNSLSKKRACFVNYKAEIEKYQNKEQAPVIIDIFFR
jgi:hypothetical protein